MRKLHRTGFTLAGLALAAATALSAAPPAGAGTGALTDFPTEFSEGFIVNVNSGLCLQPSGDNPFGNGDIIVQRPCNNTVAQLWELVPIGSMRFADGILFHPSHPAYRIESAASGMCLDDRDGVTSDGATVQQWACNTTSSTMQWGSWLSTKNNQLIVNRRASLDRDAFIGLGIPSGSHEDNVPALLYELAPDPTPASLQWVYNRVV